MSELSSSLYWSMPGPSDFIGRITDASRNGRAIVLSFTDYPPNGIWSAVKRGLQNANIFEPVTLNVGEGIDLPAEIGMHFQVPTMPAESLAYHRHGHQHAVILKAEGKRAQASCEKYASSFVHAIDHGDGDVRLIVGIHDGQLMQDSSADGIHLIVFDGALSPAEIEAYVTQRMVSCGGPGSTRLARHLVTEYAGFDPVLAERLIGFDTSQILALPESLTPLLGESLLRWATNSWLSGTRTDKSAAAHPLHEWYLATHAGADQAAARKAADTRYWRACLKSIIPWLEERRPRILEILDGPLSRVEATHNQGGKITKKIGERQIVVAREELEYNDLVYFARTGEFLRLTATETGAVSVCRQAKVVRDDLAHLRRPAVVDIQALIQGMDSVID